jgi:hypothetical protein
MIDLRPVRPRLPLLTLVTLVASAGAGAVVSPGCRSAGGLPPIGGAQSADRARPYLIASVAIAPLDQITGDVDGLSRTLGLPFAGKDLLTTLAAQNRLGPEAVSQIDTTRPLGMAFVAPTNKDHEPFQALALSAHSAAAAEKLAESLGAVLEKQKGARKIQRPDGTAVWVATQGASLFTSGSLEGLQAAAALALEAQRPPASDVVVAVFPDALARWQGTDVRTALARFRTQIINEQLAAAQARGLPIPGRAERLMYEAGLDLVLEPMAETGSGTISVDLDAQKGIRFGVRMNPRPGSAFAKRLGTPTPYAVDPALFAAGGGDPGNSIVGVWAVGASPFWLDLYQRMFQAQAQAGVRGAAAVGQGFQALRPFLTGAGSGAIRARGGVMANDIVLPLRSGAPTAVLDAIAGVTTSRGFTDWLSEIYGQARPQVQARRERDTLRTELAFPLRNRPGDPGTALKAFFGSPTVTMLTTVSGGRLVTATEPAASARLLALAAPHGPPPPPDVAGAMAETRGQDGFFFLDVWSFIKPAIGLAAPPREAQMIGMVLAMPGFSQLKLPVVASYRGGDALTAELRVPLATLANAANVARPFLGGSLIRP